MDVYNFLWRGRDFELSHLWHVSVLLAVFILGTAGIYAVYFKDIFVPYFIMNSSKITECASPILLFVFVSVVITALGVVFSKLWIMMANASSFFTVPIYELILCESTTEAKVDSKLSSKCFVYTINITIGVMFVILFMMLMAVHIVWVMCKAKQICNQCTKLDCAFLVLSILIVVCSTICPICCITKWCMKSNGKKESDGDKKTPKQESDKEKESIGNEKISKKNQNNSNILRKISIKNFIIPNLIIIVYLFKTSCSEKDKEDNLWTR